MSILIGLIPAIAWGLLPIAVSRIGGKETNQILGTTAGTFLVALATFLILRPEMNVRIFLLSALSGALWVVGQIGQYRAYRQIGVSRTMPVSSGLQLVGTSLAGVLAFGEWSSTIAKITGFTGLAIVIGGIYLTSLKDGGNKDLSGDKPAYILLILTTFGYLAYNAIPDIVGTKGTSIFLPQACGMLVAAIVYVLFTGHASAFKEKESWKNIFSGLLFSIAALTYILSAQQNGIATGFVLAQLSVVLSTILGIVVLREKKTSFELKATFIGLVLILGGGTAIAFL